MADVFCINCGLIFDSHVVPCPRCLRCCRCGMKCPRGTTKCPNCGHPSDLESLGELEKKLDPTLPTNQKTIRSCEWEWENDQLVERFNFWGQLVLALLGAVCTMLLDALLMGAGIQDIWIRGPVCVLTLVASLRGFFTLLRRGWFRGLFREKQE